MFSAPDTHKARSSKAALCRFVIVTAAISLSLVGVVSANSEYSEGLGAYIDGDYELAQTHWLEAAKTDDYRAMFNLGLMHQQELVPGSQPDKAKRWFRLAGQGGYAASDYHHATWLIEEAGVSDDAVMFLQRAANNGYFPAQQKLTKLAAAGQIDASLASTASPDQYLSEAWLKQRSGDAWTIQVLAFEDLGSVKTFIDEHRLQNKAAYFSETKEGDKLYKLVLGEYTSKQEADTARAELSSALQEHGPWLRSFASVQRVIASQ